MRRTHLHGHTNILKRFLVHAGGFNLGLVMRHLIGVGTPRGLQGRLAVVLATLYVLISAAPRWLTAIMASPRRIAVGCGRSASPTALDINSQAMMTCATGF